MTIHPLHKLFSTADTLKASDGTVLQRELRCKYCPKTWELHRYPSGPRQGKWRVVELNQLRRHLRDECDYSGNDDILSVASATNVRDAFARVGEIRRVHGRPWPPPLSPPATSARDQPTVTAAAASQSPASQSPRTTSTLQQDQRFGFVVDTPMSPSEGHRTTPSAMPHDGPSTLPCHDRDWVYLLNRNGRAIADWDAADRGAWLEHMPWGEEDNDQLNTLLGKLVCTTGCAIRILASRAVCALTKMVHPSSVVRSVSTFTRSIIPALAKEAQEWVRQRLHAAKYVTLQADLWTAAHGRCVYAHLATTSEGEVMVVHAPERTGVKHDAKMVAKDMQQAIAMVDAAPASLDTPSPPPDSAAAGRSKVVAVMTDAASCNTSAAELVLPQYPGLLWVTCNVHRMHNLVKRLCSFAAHKKLHEAAQDVVAAVTRSNALNRLLDKWRSMFHRHKLPTIDEMREEFEDANKEQCEAIDNFAREHKARYGSDNAAKPSNTGLVSAVETRFASYVALLDSLAHNRPVLQLVAACYPGDFTTPKQRDARRFIGDEEQWRKLDDLLTMLRPIRDAIVALEADDTTLGTAYHYWLVIAAHLHHLELFMGTLPPSIGP